MENPVNLWLDETRFLVEATDFERLILWERWHETHSWVQDYKGYWIEVGQVLDMPVGINLTWVLINGHRVLFYQGVSRMLDYEMIQNWLRAHYPIFWDQETRWAHCDAMNFHLCMHAIEELEREAQAKKVP